MKKIKDSIIVIGEAITEYYYFNSLKDTYRQLNIRPTYPKHSAGLDYLEQEIDKAIDAGYSQIICVVDIFFLFYFAYTSRCFQNQPELLKELSNHCAYEKAEIFFKKHSLHQYFENEGGDFMLALRNAAQSMKEKEETERNYTYSQMAELFEALGIRAE